ncbi:DUF1501 domain-containing protein [Schlesneria paludicola]|uniref:DUF1501 domain-containing protein n=1 Tax=Schlesneria paludicola TaxID=360056 RepID=UPI00029A522B|nr:DUF1501 domain-containing protein [Schlesneria paludicola]
MQNSNARQPQQTTRRELLARGAHGFGAMALWHLLNRDAVTGSERATHHSPRAKNVIFIFMAGGPSHLDLFDPKPQMAKLHGEPVPASLLASLVDPLIRTSARVMASPRTFQRRANCEIEFSDLLPQTGAMADELCLIRSMTTDQSNHDPAQLLLSCGTPLFGHPSMGAWINYGLGSVSQDMPGYVVLMSNSGKGVDAGTALWGSGYLPSTFRGVTFRNSSDPILYLSNPVGITNATQRARLDVLRDLNRIHEASTGDNEIASRIAAYELAFRMQTAAPELLDFRQETAATRAMYGLDQDVTRSFGGNCLLARRMVERGVRFVQLFHSTWDDHSNLNANLKTNCDMTDLPTAGLLRDLKQRGLLDDTLVVWAGEFGRTPMGEVRRGTSPGHEGRDHHPFAFSVWMAGGGVKRGMIHGRTDDFGYGVVESPVHVHDLQATILHLLGIDHEKLTYRHSGRDFRLTDVHGKVVSEILI